MTALANQGTAARTRYLFSLTRTLALSEFKTRYAGSVLGYFWSVSKPFALFGVLYVIFTHVLRFGTGIEHYPVMLLVAIVLWSFFLEVTSSSLAVLVARSDLLRKVSFPRLALPVSVSITAALALVFNLVAVVAFMLLNGVEPRLEWLWFPVLLVELYACALGVGLILSVLYVGLRDIGQVWELVAQLLFYSTPILYPLSLVPERFQSWMLFNPVAQIIQQSREVLVGPQSGVARDALDGWLVAIPYAIAVVLLLGGIVMFQRAAPRIAERL